MPSRALLGMTTSTGWTITEELKNTLGSGGNFCCRYRATSADGKLGFLKAMDLTSAISGGIRELQKLINSFVFEQDILFFCKDRKMSRVVTPLDAGTIVVANHPPPINEVYYVIFECADGDLRQQYIEPNTINWKDAFKALHHTALGTLQLHQAGIAHQDIKPSNILCFDKKISKISDLGRVTDDKGKSPFSGMAFTGDRSYAPIEERYGFVPKEFRERFYADIHMVGSLAYHLVSGIQITPVLLKEAQLIVPNILSMSYFDALPFFQTSYNKVISDFHKECSALFPINVANQLQNIVFEMCNPNIKERACLSDNQKISKITINRYVGKFATLNRAAMTSGLK